MKRLWLVIPAVILVLLFFAILTYIRSPGTLITIRRTSDGKIVQSLLSNNRRDINTSSIVFSRDGGLLASVSTDFREASPDTVRIWRVRDWKLVCTIGDTGLRNVESLAFSRDSCLLVLAGQDNKTNTAVARMHRVQDGSRERTVDTRVPCFGMVRQAMLSPNGGLLAIQLDAAYLSSFGIRQPQDGIGVYRVHDGRSIGTVTRNRPGISHCDYYRCIISEDEKLLATTDGDVWCISDFRLLKELKYNDAWSVAFSPNCKYLVAGLAGHILLYRISDGKLERRLNLPEGTGDIAFSPNCKLLAAEGSLWRVSDGKPLYTWEPQGEGNVSCVAFSPDGELLASGRWCNKESRFSQFWIYLRYGLFPGGSR